MKRVALLNLALCAAVVAVGCLSNTTPTATTTPATATAAAAGPKAETKHDAWWCAEHGIPEAECSMCSDKVAAEFKAKGDWCDKHDRAKSQCFVCDPKLKEKFAAKYRAKYGKEPPPIEDEGK